MGKKWKQWQILFSWSPKSLSMVDCSHEIKRCLLLGRKTMTNVDSILNAETSLCCQSLYGQNYSFPSVHVQMLELDHKEGWATKNWCFWTVVLRKTLENLLDSKEVKPACCFDDHNFAVQSEVKGCDSSSSIFLSQDCFSYLFVVFPHKL